MRSGITVVVESARPSRPAPRWNLTVRVALAGVSTVVLAALLFSLLIRTARELHRAEMATAHAGRVLVLLTETQRHSDLASFGVRGTILSGNFRFQAEGTRSLLKAEDDVAELAGLVRDSPWQGARIESIRTAVASLADHRIVPDDASRFASARARFAAARAVDLRRHALDQQFRGFTVEENRVAALRAGRVQRLNRRIVTVSVATLAGVSLLILALVAFFSLSVARPLTRLSRIVTRIAHGEEGLSVETNAVGELGDLQRAFDKMSASVTERRHAILDHAPIAIWEKEGDQVNWMSPYWSVMTGVELSSGPLPLSAIADSVHPDDVERVLENHRVGASNGEPYSHRYRMVQPDGSLRHMWTRSTPLKSSDGKTRVIGFTLDVSDEEVAREQLLHSQRLESVGQLAGGVAHDFNNLLTVITGYTAIALQGLPLESDSAPHLQQVAIAADRAAALTRQLLAFSRKQVLLAENIDVNDVIRGLMPMLERLIEEDVELGLQLDEDLPQVFFDRGQLEQVLVNLIVNARDASPEGGTILVETGTMFLDASYAVRHADARIGDHIVIAVSDTGTGMDKATMERIFDPFFTTKEVGQGTGLGLSTVHGILAQSGGNIWVYSEEGHGTTFKIYIPVASTIDGMPHERLADKSFTPSRTLRILVVEDDVSLRALAVEILDSADHIVLGAGSVAEALEILAANAIDLVISDVVMQGGSGRQLAGIQDSEGYRPKLILMSGYTEETITRQELLDSGAQFLEKPFTPRDLLKIVAQTDFPLASSGAT